MSENFDPSRWEILASRFVDNTLTDEQLSELLELLENEPGLSKILYDHVYQESLCFDLAKGNGDLPDQVDLLGEIGQRYMEIFEKGEAADSRTGRFPPLAVSGRKKLNLSQILFRSGGPVIVAAVLIAMWLYIPRFSRSNGNTQQEVAVKIKSGSAEDLSSAIAVVKLASNLRGGQTSGAIPKTGDMLYPGQLQFESGLLVVDFFDGASIAAEGPADLRFLSSKHVYCAAGRVTADVPEQAVGFRIDTPQTKIVDLGTSFQVDVRDEKSFVSVIEGEIELHNAQDGVQTLREGEHVLVREAGIVNPVEAPASDFRARPGGTAQMLEQLKREEQEHLAEKWEKHRQWVNADPSLLIHFNFSEGNLFDQRKVHNLTERGRDNPAYGLLVDCRLTRGRWQEKGAVEFRRLSDRCRFNIPGEFSALTMACWLRVDGLDRLYSSILTTDGIDLGEVHWRLLSTGEVELRIHYSRTEPCLQVVSKKVITPSRLGEWLHLAALIDAENEQVVLYLNGEAIHREKFILTVPIRFKNAQLGNWTIDPRWDSEQPFRHLSGAMESFMFFNRALKDEDVKKLYEGFSVAGTQQ